jgi:hypothetical protein
VETLRTRRGLGLCSTHELVSKERLLGSTDFESLRSLVGKLVANPCWGVSAGGCTGSMFILSLGPKTRRRTPVRNPNLPELQRLYEAELRVYVECAAWRLEDKRGVITSSSDDSSPDGPMVSGLSQLVGRSVAAARVIPPCMDCDIEFENGLRLLIFCDQVQEDLPNYTVSCREFSVAVGCRSELASEGSLE